jgi:hypothetical protein
MSRTLILYIVTNFSLWPGWQSVSNRSLKCSFRIDTYGIYCVVCLGNFEAGNAAAELGTKLTEFPEQAEHTKSIGPNFHFMVLSQFLLYG